MLAGRARAPPWAGAAPRDSGVTIPAPPSGLTGAGGNIAEDAVGGLAAKIAFSKVAISIRDEF
jgi:hypothetical protein